MVDRAEPALNVHVKFVVPAAVEPGMRHLVEAGLSARHEPLHKETALINNTNDAVHVVDNGC